MAANHLASIRRFDDLVRYLEDELGWPLQEYGFDDLTFEFSPAEIGLKDEDAARVKAIHQLRPLATGQPWGIFFVEFENKKLPVVVLRRILSHLALKKRASANKAHAPSWHAEDLLFITAFGEESSEAREIAFAHFHESPGDLPTLHVLGWDGSDIPLKLANVDRVLHERLRWPDDESDSAAWRDNWRKPFRHKIGHVIQTADLLAEELAKLARGIRDRAKRMLAAESDKGPLTKLYKAFQTALIHDLTPEGFADTYAQTITYGLLTAAISRTEMSEGRYGTALIAQNVVDMVPVTNPFLKEMLQTFLKVGGRKGGIDFDELGIQDVVELLRGEETDLPAILRDFGNRTRGEDPVIHFYEHFLSAYNKQLKIQRGVFYTPQPVVSYIVRSVHELLQTEFGLEDGLASTVTWGEMLASVRNSREGGNPALPETFTIPEGTSPDEPFVQILDPATGTATFLVEVIEVIHRTLTDKWKKSGASAMPKLPPLPRAGEGGGEGNKTPLALGERGGGEGAFTRFEDYWNAYIPRALLPRLHAYELMMAPYAIAHMKIGLKLAETGYKFATEERARIYLTNALEPWQRQLKLPDFEALAHEAMAVNEIKRNKRFTVVIGNPPYSGHSSNDGEWIVHLLHGEGGITGNYFMVDGAPLGEKNPKWLNDDYVKFMRLSQWHISQTGYGANAFITNHGYLDNPTFRGMRQCLMQSFDDIYLLDLHGNSKKKEKTPNGGKDENVFDIQQGVAIGIFVKRIPPAVIPAKAGIQSNQTLGSGLRRNDGSRVCHADLYGTRESKYAGLAENDLATTHWKTLQPQALFYLFVPQDETVRTEYEQGRKITEIMLVNSVGIVTARDALTIHWSREDAWRTVNDFASLPVEEARSKYDLGKDARDWQVALAQKDLRDSGLTQTKLAPVLYRPFDVRHTYYTDNSRGFHCMPRGEVMRQMLAGNNLALITSRMTKGETFQHAQVTRNIVEVICMSPKTSNNGFVFPLYLYLIGEKKRDLFDNDNPSTTPSGRRPNLAPEFIADFSTRLQLDFVPDGCGDLKKTFGPEDVFHYAYAVFHSPTYRSRYAEFLKIDFPRLPLTGSIELFRALAKLGGDLVALHLLESPKVNDFITRLEGAGDNSIPKKPTYKDGAVWINATQRFEGVPEAVWNFHIGGYQVCEKWLKDRKGRTLSADDIAHYQRIVVALSETIRLMAEIDRVIESHGGWPDAFATSEINPDAG